MLTLLDTLRRAEGPHPWVIPLLSPGHHHPATSSDAAVASTAVQGEVYPGCGRIGVYPGGV